MDGWMDGRGFEFELGRFSGGMRWGNEVNLEVKGELVVGLVVKMAIREDPCVVGSALR